jgi:hypothetical protein
MSNVRAVLSWVCPHNLGSLAAARVTPHTVSLTSNTGKPPISPYAARPQRREHLRRTRDGVVCGVGRAGGGGAEAPAVAAGGALVLA